ncbi:MAG: hypothetical protein K2W99_04265 [Chthoniobacterales bacterium]|nr:hypothetical protein [Chthoniobacterales bacterium]
MSNFFPELARDLKRKVARTQELFSRSISLWDDLENTVRLSNCSLDEWKKKAEKLEGINGVFYPAHLEVMKQHLERSKQRRVKEVPYSINLTKIPASRLIKKV